MNIHNIILKYCLENIFFWIFDFFQCQKCKKADPLSYLTSSPFFSFWNTTILHFSFYLIWFQLINFNLAMCCNLCHVLSQNCLFINKITTSGHSVRIVYVLDSLGCSTNQSWPFDIKPRTDSLFLSLCSCWPVTTLCLLAYFLLLALFLSASSRPSKLPQSSSRAHSQIYEPL